MKLPAATTHLLRGKSRRLKWCTACVVTIVIIAIIAIPLAVILPRNSAAAKGLKSKILVPLYIYPEPGAWDPLYEVVTSHPNRHFIVILNPNSGPGSSSLPADQYVNQIQKLNDFPNVQSVGYVRTGYATRNISDVLGDVAVYSGWDTSANATMGSGLAVHGIFFDEAPSEYSTANAEYMLTINHAVKNSIGILGDKTIIQNPGTIPDPRLVDSTTDYSVVFEGSYKEFNERQSLLTALPLDRKRYSFVIHSIPENLSTADIKKFAAKASRKSDLLSLIDLDANFYERFSPNWSSYVDIIPS